MQDLEIQTTEEEQEASAAEAGATGSEVGSTRKGPEPGPGDAASLLEALRASGALTSSALALAEGSVGRNGGSIVLALGAIPGVPLEQVAMLVARYNGLSFAHLEPGKVAPEVFTYVSFPKWHEVRALPVVQEADLVTVAAADPDLLAEAEDQLRANNLQLRVVVAPLDEIESELDRLSGPEDVPVVLEQSTLLSRAAMQLATLLSEDDGPGCVEVLLGLAVDMKASDIHVAWEPDCLTARLRKDGSLRPLKVAASDVMVHRVISSFKVLAGLDISERRHPQDGRARIRLIRRNPTISVLARVATIPCRQGEKLAVRVLETTHMMDLAEIGLSGENLAKVREALRYPSGLFLVTGPTGCGKTTSLYAALQHLTRDDVSIFTIEDPIEFEFPHAYQSQVNEAANVTFPMLLRALVRQDPDIVLLGEIRDAESAQTALQAAHSGRLLLSSLHSNSASTALTRLIQMGVEPFVLGSCTRAIIGQRLVRRLCACKRPVYRMPEKHVQVKEMLGLVGSSLFEPVGCQSCLFTGFRGRIALMEVLTLDKEIANLVMAGATSTQILEAARAGGFRVMAYDGFSKAFNGLTTVMEVERQVGPAPGLEAT